MPPDERFVHRTKNLNKALQALKGSLADPVTEPRDLSGIIKDFEIVYELSWKTLKDFLEKQGHETTSAKDVFSRAYQLGLLKQESVWYEMINDRNLTVHTYDETLAGGMVERIRTQYYSAFSSLLVLISK